MRVFVGALLGIAAMPGVAHAACDTADNDSERAACIGQELRASDGVINEVYGRLRARLDPRGADALRHQEIAWIRTRARLCQVDLKEPDRDRWIANLLQDYSKTVCVVRFTDARVAELRAQEAALSSPAEAQQGAPANLPLPPPLATSGEDVFGLMAQRAPSSGKWYFEVVIDQGEIAKEVSADIFVGVQGEGAGAVGTLRPIHPRNVGQPPLNIGIAVDLDAGELYVRENGAWHTPPGSSGGLEVRLGRRYFAKLTSSVPLGRYLDSGWVVANFGQHNFSYALPDGYVALDSHNPTRLVE
jgi:uncharacterized protein YecT (DUF1311 family)